MKPALVSRLLNDRRRTIGLDVESLGIQVAEKILVSEGIASQRDTDRINSIRIQSECEADRTESACRKKQEQASYARALAEQISAKNERLAATSTFGFTGDNERADTDSTEEVLRVAKAKQQAEWLKQQIFEKLVRQSTVKGEDCGPAQVDDNMDRRVAISRADLQRKYAEANKLAASRSTPTEHPIERPAAVSLVEGRVHGPRTDFRGKPQDEVRSELLLGNSDLLAAKARAISLERERDRLANQIAEQLNQAECARRDAIARKRKEDELAAHDVTRKSVIEKQRIAHSLLTEYVYNGQSFEAQHRPTAEVGFFDKRFGNSLV